MKDHLDVAQFFVALVIAGRMTLAAAQKAYAVWEGNHGTRH